MINMKKLLCIMLICMVTVSGFMPSVEAVSTEPEAMELVERAANQFRVTVPGNTLYVASSSFFMNAEQSVTINASYSLKTASVDFGLIGPDGLFYYESAKDGNVKVVFDIKDAGSYTLAIRNNSSSEISVSGYVNH